MEASGQTVDNARLAEMARTCACFNFRKASRSVTQLFDQRLSPVGLRSTQLVILITSQLVGPSNIARLARELVMDRSTLTRNLKPLVAHGYLQLTRLAAGRQKAVEITDEGREALLRAAPYWEQAQSHLVGRFGDEQWDKIMHELSAIVDAAKAHEV